MKFLIKDNDKARIKEVVAVLVDLIETDDYGARALIKQNVDIVYNILDTAEKYEEKSGVEKFREQMTDFYEYDVSSVSDETLLKIINDVQDELEAVDESYHNACDEAIHTVAERYGLKPINE